MRVLIEFKCDGAAFAGDDFDRALAHICGQAALKVRAQKDRAPGCICITPEAADLLFDINGNTIGTVKLEGE